MNNLVEPSTIEALPVLGVENEYTIESGIDVIRATGTGRPLFLLHDIHGDAAYGAALLPHINVDMPIYGVPGMAPHERLPRTIEALATRCIRLIRAAQPNGPYRLAGWSFGGTLAYEIAVQLIGQDQAVEFLGLIDSACPTVLRRAGCMTSVPSIEQQLLECCEENQSAFDAASSIAFAKLRAANEPNFEDMLQRCRAACLLPSDLIDKDSAQTRHYLARLAAHRYAQQHYAVQRLPIPVHLFSSAQGSPSQGELGDPLKGWGKILSPEQLRLIRVQVSAGTALRSSHVAALGRSLGEAVREAASGSLPRVTLLETKYDPHVSVQTGRRACIPIFCVPGAGNSVTHFAAWAQALGEEWPVHGLQPRGVAGGLVPHSTVQAAAAQYLGAIHEAHPRGPVHLVGHSFGGWIVLELAHLLRARGRTVASLTVIDAEAPDYQDPLGGDYTSTEVLVELVDMIEMAVNKPLGIKAPDLAPLDDIGRQRVLHQALVRVGMMPMRSGPEVLAGIVRTFGAALRTTYCPAAPYPDPLRLVTVSDTRINANADKRRCEEQLQGWRRWAPRLSSWHGPGNHMTLLDLPHVTAVADWWRSGPRVGAAHSP